MMPTPFAADPLPIDALLPELSGALARGHALLRAPTGSGKSTHAPLALMAADWLGGQRILMLEPRRAAARLTAARMAALLGEPLGERVGYQVRHERRVSAATRIEVVTEGILTRRLQTDPELGGVGLLIFDELHERNLHADLGLALALEVIAGLRPELRLLLMSATLDPAPLLRLLGQATLLESAGRAHPVAIHYAERPPDADPVRAMVAGIRTALAEHPGDLLAFLPGIAEIQRCQAQLASDPKLAVELLPLHGSLSSAEQDRVLQAAAHARRRCILATDIAETSVTIPGIRIVVDSGLARKPRLVPGSGLTALVTEPIPQAAAEQRAGRAGRVAPGVCVRLWTRAQEQGRPVQYAPEILTADLAPLALELALWGVGHPAELRWLDPPPEPAWQQALALLRDLALLDEAARLTARGRAIAGLPVHPRLGALLAASHPAARELAADLCALLSERDPLVAAPGVAREADLQIRLQALAAWRAGRSSPGLDGRRLAGIDRAARQLRRLAQGLPAGDLATPGALLAIAYPDRIAQRRGEGDGRYLLSGGRGARLALDDPLGAAPYLVAAVLDARERDARIQLALSMSVEELRDACAGRLRSGRQVAWDAERERVTAREVEQLGALTLRALPVPASTADPVAPLLLAQARARPDLALTWSPQVRQLQGRLALLRRIEPAADWPDVSPAALASALEDWLGPWLQDCRGLADLRALDLAAIIRSRLDWPAQQRLEQETPPHLITPAGRPRPIDYQAGDQPVLAIPLQELFGLSTTPRICSGRVPITLQLLSPARRPIQVTQDLASFWDRTYAEVRKELRGRYPKHQWPEDPRSTPPLVGGLKRRAP